MIEDSVLSVENERTDAGRDGRTRLARSNSQARTGTGKYSLTTSRVGSHHNKIAGYSIFLLKVSRADHTRILQ